MNEPNLNPNANPLEPAENQLRSWTPRAPSAVLEQRVFRRQTATPARHVGAPAWSWLAPAFASCLTLLVAVGGPAGHFSAAPGGGAGGLWAGPYPSPQFQRISLEHNLFACFRSPSLGWTNGANLASSNGSFSLGMTNGF